MWDILPITRKNLLQPENIIGLFLEKKSWKHTWFIILFLLVWIVNFHQRLNYIQSAKGIWKKKFLPNEMHKSNGTESFYYASVKPFSVKTLEKVLSHQNKFEPWIILKKWLFKSRQNSSTTYHPFLVDKKKLTAESFVA